jgi:hypothetical protein
MNAKGHHDSRRVRWRAKLQRVATDAIETVYQIVRETGVSSVKGVLLE